MLLDSIYCLILWWLYSLSNKYATIGFYSLFRFKESHSTLYLLFYCRHRFYLVECRLWYLLGFLLTISDSFSLLFLLPHPVLSVYLYSFRRNKKNSSKKSECVSHSATLLMNVIVCMIYNWNIISIRIYFVVSYYLFVRIYHRV